MAPDECPVHDTDPDATVYINDQPWTAALVCETWHDTAPIRAELKHVMHETLTRERGKMFWASHLG